MRIGHSLLILSLMLLMACTVLPAGKSHKETLPSPVEERASKKDSPPPKSVKPRPAQLAAKEYLQQAASAMKKGALSSAVQTLGSASVQYPENKDIRTALDSANRKLKHKQDEIDDRLLAVRTQALLQEVQLKKQQQQLDPNDHVIRADLEQSQISLARMQPGLKTCAKRQSRLRLELAKNCASLFLSMEEDKTVRQLLNDMEAWEKKRATRETKKKEVVQTKKMKTSVLSARILVKQEEHFKALQLLEQVLADEPGQLEAQELLFQVQGYLERQTSILLNAGDTFYRDGKIESAMNSWRAVLEINPELEAAREKLRRAQKVLDNLQLLREEKTVPESKPKPTTK